MIVSYFRSSSLQNVEFCESQYFLTYCLGLERKVGKKANLGTTCHKILEALALLKLNFQNNGNEPDFDDTLTIIDGAIGKFCISVDALMNKATVDELIKRAYDYYSAKEPGGFTKKDFVDIETWVYTVLFYNDGVFDPRKRTIIDAEPHFDITMEQDWAKYDYTVGEEHIVGQLAIKGTIDLITKINDDTIEIVDWKTGQRKNWATGEEKTYEKLCQDPQLMLYYYAASKMYPWAKNIVLTIYFIKDGGPFTICFDTSTIQQMEGILEERFKYVQSVKMPKMVSERQTDFRCTKICDYYKNNWPGTQVNQCKFIHEKIKKHGIDYVQEHFQQEGHKLDFYSQPGE